MWYTNKTRMQASEAIRGICTGWILGFLSLLAWISFSYITLTPTLYLRPFWGIGNRLRTLRVAFDLARVLKRRLVLVESVDVGCDVYLTTLLDVPVDGILYTKALVPLYRTTIKSNGKGDCSLTMPLEEFKKISNKALLIEACTLNVAGLEETSEFYERTSPRPMITRPMRNMLEMVRNANAVGVHIRQGTVSDYKQGFFFGKWKNSSSEIPIGCCSKALVGDEVVCPTSAPCVDGFVAKMKEYPPETIFYVASDRPGCLLQLKEIYGNRILHQPIEIESSTNSVRGMRDFVALSSCRELIISNVSSFSGEASRVNNIQRIRIDQ